jgi:hypothetical protein
LVGITRRDGTSIGVVVFDTMEVVTTMFEDERIVCPANIAKGYNFWDGTVVDSNVYGEGILYLWSILVTFCKMVTKKWPI